MSKHVMKTDEKKELRKMYEWACNKYLHEFCKKHELPFEDDMWVAGDVGTIAMVGDYFFDLDDMRYDIDNNCQKDAIIEWYDYIVRIGSLDCEKRINFESWVKGAPKPYTEEELKEIERLHGEVEKAKELLEKAIQDAKGEN
jgi:hypothetical protein